MIKHLKRFVPLFLLISIWGGLSACQSQGEQLYYAIEMYGEICGYTESHIRHIEMNGKTVIQLTENVTSMSEALGMPVDTKVKAESLIDPETGQLVSSEVDVDQGTVRILISATFEEDLAEITLNMGGGTKEIPLSPDIIVENSYFFPHLIQDFGREGLEKKQYKILDILDRKVYDVSCSKRGSEQIELAGNLYNTIVIDSLNLGIGLKTRLWINIENGYLLKAEGPTQTVFLTDKSVKYKLQRVSIDERLFAKVGVMIQDLEKISYMKVRATLEPIGNWATPESLNVRGQSFSGTVVNNLIEGIFEIRHEHYDGSNPPSFPPDYGNNPELQPFLEPQDLIESDDPVLVEKAKALTEGAQDAWEASKRLSQWVAEEIAYAIPGGGSARNTYDLRAGECGAHSMLFAAFCRAVGIPARVVWGCMYVPNEGGSFGQHGWNEVFMGDAGWIPIDTTARQIDFCDSGHIRLGLLSSKHIAYLPKKMEILDYQAGSHSFEQIEEISESSEFAGFVGAYQGPDNVLTILVQNDSLAIDIPGQMAYELKEPDENGIRYFKMTPDAGVSFDQSQSGKVDRMTLHVKTRIIKTAEDEGGNTRVPEEFRAYLGVYSIPAANIKLTVLFRDNNLAVNDPSEGIIGLKGPDDEGMWIDEFDENKISFILDDEGQAKQMIIHQTIYCEKID